MKDFKQCYDLKHWEFAAASHARMKALLESAKSQVLKDYAQERISAYEQEYPQLKD